MKIWFYHFQNKFDVYFYNVFVAAYGDVLTYYVSKLDL